MQRWQVCMCIGMVIVFQWLCSRKDTDSCACAHLNVSTMGKISSKTSILSSMGSIQAFTLAYRLNSAVKPTK